MTTPGIHRETAFDRVCELLADHTGVYPRGNGRQRSARCPVHEDRTPSLSVTAGNERVLLKCQAGCDTDDILAALGITRADLFDEPKQPRPKPTVIAEYTYVNEHGEVLYAKERRLPKDFRLKRPDGRGGWAWKNVLRDTPRLVLYHLPEVAEAIRTGQTIYVVEGEKDADRIAELGAVATCNVEGAAKAGQRPKWRRAYADTLAGAKEVVIIADRDDAGYAHAHAIRASLKGKVERVHVVQAAVDKPHADVSDHLAAGHSLDQLQPAPLTDHEQQDAPPDETDPTARRLRLTPAAAIKPRPVRWVWQDRIPTATITLIPGRAGIGKSLLLTWLIARITRGELPGIHYGTPKPVFIVATEDSWAHTIVPRLIVAGANLNLVYCVDVVIEDTAIGPLILPRDCPMLIAEVKRVGAAMIAADPLMSLIDANLDTHRNREVRAALEPLAAAADQAACAVVGLAHFNKSTGSDPVGLITGSSAFGEVVRAVIGVARDTDADDGSCVISQAKNNLGRLDLASLRYVIDNATVETDEGDAEVGRLRIVGETDRTVADILGDRVDPEERTERDEAADWLIGFLMDSGGEAPYTDIARAARGNGIAERTLKRARTRAKVTTHRSGWPARAFWQLSQATVGPTPTSGPTGPTGPTQSQTVTETQLGQPAQLGHQSGHTTHTQNGRSETVTPVGPPSEGLHARARENAPNQPGDTCPQCGWPKNSIGCNCPA